MWGPAPLGAPLLTRAVRRTGLPIGRAPPQVRLLPPPASRRGAVAASRVLVRARVAAARTAAGRCWPRTNCAHAPLCHHSTQPHAAAHQCATPARSGCVPARSRPTRSIFCRPVGCQTRRTPQHQPPGTRGHRQRCSPSAACSSALAHLVRLGGLLARMSSVVRKIVGPRRPWNGGPGSNARGGRRCRPANDAPGRPPPRDGAVMCR